MTPVFDLQLIARRRLTAPLASVLIFGLSVAVPLSAQDPAPGDPAPTPGQEQPDPAPATQPTPAPAPVPAATEAEKKEEAAPAVQPQPTPAAEPAGAVTPAETAPAPRANNTPRPRRETPPARQPAAAESAPAPEPGQSTPAPGQAPAEGPAPIPVAQGMADELPAFDRELLPEYGELQTPPREFPHLLDDGQQPATPDPDSAGDGAGEVEDGQAQADEGPGWFSSMLDTIWSDRTVRNGIFVVALILVFIVFRLRNGRGKGYL